MGHGAVPLWQHLLHWGAGLRCMSLLQEHMGLLRGLIVKIPEQHADLAVLLDQDPELDFFNNVAHLQLHRRQRALHRLTKVAYLWRTAYCTLCYSRRHLMLVLIWTCGISTADRAAVQHVQVIWPGCSEMPQPSLRGLHDKLVRSPVRSAI